MTPLLPQFIDVMQRGLVVLEKGTPEVIDDCFADFEQFTADDFIDAAFVMADELRNPPSAPDAIGANGESLYCIECMADRLGMTVAEIPAVFKHFYYDGEIQLVN